MEKVNRKNIRKTLSKKVGQLNDIVADFDEILSLLEVDFYRVAIFGSARLQPETELYRQAYDLAYKLGTMGVDVVTGGGPGLMDAANRGVKAGGAESRSIGLPISLPFESDANNHLDVKHEHRRFSSRLDEFMRISHAVIVTPGGIGTVLELMYTWQLIQVKHIQPRPFFLIDSDGMWADFLKWFEEHPVQKKLMSQTDMDMITVCSDVDEVIQILQPKISEFAVSRHKHGSHSNPL
ncbi:MAG: TIGR00730 family Rossman fold protein [Oligoflexales bacterium]